MDETELTKETLKHFELDKSVLADHYMGYTEQIKNIGIAITRHIKKGKGRVIIYFDPDFPRYLIKYENEEQVEKIGGEKVEANQTNFWEIHFPDSSERTKAQMIYKHLTETFYEKEKVTSFIRSLEKCSYLEGIDYEKKSRIPFCSGEGYKEILDHYDLTPDDTKKANVFDSDCFNRMCVIIGNVWKINSRARITLDHDPNFPKSVVRTEFFKD